MCFKRLISFLLLFFAIITGVAQAQERTHVVQRGETLRSIAEQYGISVDQIETANPNAKNYIYVGMKLVIPSVMSQSTESLQKSTPSDTSLPQSSKAESATTRIEEKTTQELVSNKKKRLSINRRSNVTFRSFFIPITKGEGEGIEVSEILGIPIGVGFSTWKGNSIYDVNFYVSYSQRFYLGSGGMYLNPESGLEYDSVSYYDNGSYRKKRGISLRLNPLFGYQIIAGLSVEGGALATFYRFKSFGINMTLGVSYRF